MQSGRTYNLHADCETKIKHLRHSVEQHIVNTVNSWTYSSHLNWWTVVNPVEGYASILLKSYVVGRFTGLLNWSLASKHDEILKFIVNKQWENNAFQTREVRDWYETSSVILYFIL